MDKASEHYSEDCGLEPHSGASQPGAATGQGGVGWCGGRKGVPPSSCLAHMAPASSSSHDSLAEWSKALASGASPSNAAHMELDSQGEREVLQPAIMALRAYMNNYLPTHELPLAASKSPWQCVQTI